MDPLRAPWLSWGPYLWADGLVPRSDGLIWRCEDFGTDGTHPSSLGREKVAGLLLDFFRTDPRTSPWFVDCDPGDPGVFAAPPEVLGVRLGRSATGEVEIVWDSLAPVVGPGTS